eukprot:761511-Hanusia_phi.AAC.2
MKWSGGPHLQSTAGGRFPCWSSRDEAINDKRSYRKVSPSASKPHRQTGGSAQREVSSMGWRESHRRLSTANSLWLSSAATAFEVVHFNSSPRWVHWKVREICAKRVSCHPADVLRQQHQV